MDYVYFKYLMFRMIKYDEKSRVMRKNFFGHYAGGGGEEGFLAFFWPKFTKNVAGEGGGGQNVEK
jgi:hypothetical protein